MKRRFVLAMLSVILPLAIESMAQERVAEADSRLPQLKMEQLSDQQRQFADQIMKVSSVGIAGPYNVMLRSPVMGERLFALLDYLRFQTSVPRHLNEFAILIQGRLWSSILEWNAHYPLAIKAGLPAAVADDLKLGKRPASMKPDEAMVYDLCMELSTKHEVSDQTYKKARELFSEQQIADLVTVSGTYMTVAMMVKGFRRETAALTELEKQSH